MPVPRPLVLVILDGFGERKEKDDNAVKLAASPHLDALFASYPHTLIGTSGPDVGLPPGQMGNSEVGHLNFGAGRIARMDIARIDNAIYEKSFSSNPVLAEVMGAAKRRGGRLHLFGLVSSGGVHSSLEHLLALIAWARSEGVKVVVHAFLDGRDVQPGTAPGFLRDVEAAIGGAGVIGTVSGRYYGMDRDNRWERVEKAFRAIVNAEGTRHESALEGVDASYASGKTDEFVLPFVVGDYSGVQPGDAGLHFNFRPDRARELTRALASRDFGPSNPKGSPDQFARPSDPAPPFTTFACMTTYDGTLGLPIAFPKEHYPDIFPEVIARANKTQLRCAETEKYAHVTYFFNGGREALFDGEERIMIPSPKEVATYDEKPEMSADGVAAAVVEAVESGKFDFVLVNFANPDMVGHTGVLSAAIHAVEAVDRGVGRIAEAVKRKGGALIVTADHGNCELMKDPASGQPHTSHTLNPVPLLYVDDANANATLRPWGRICDVAPTMLQILGLPQPVAMTGTSLLSS